MGELLDIPQLCKATVDWTPTSQYISEYTSLSKVKAESLTRRYRRQKILEINLSQRPGSVDTLQLNYFSSSDEEDNDTESEEEELREQEIEFLRQQQKEQMAVFQENYGRIRVLQYQEVE